MFPIVLLSFFGCVYQWLSQDRLFMACSGVMMEKEVRVWLWENQFLDLVATWAPSAPKAASAGWPTVEVAVCQLKSVGHGVSVHMPTCMGDLHLMNHYVPLVSTPWGRRA